MPESRRIVVPEFPQSRGAFGARKPFRPTPSMITTFSGVTSTGTPNCLRQESVLCGSALAGKLCNFEVPLAMEAKRAALWAIDLSAGSFASPAKQVDV